MATKRHESEPARSTEKKVVPFNIRVSTDEKTAFSEAAELAGVPLSAWVRERLRRIARRELEEANRPVAFLKDIKI